MGCQGQTAFCGSPGPSIEAKRNKITAMAALGRHSFQSASRNNLALHN